MPLKKLVRCPAWSKVNFHAEKSRKQLFRGMLSYSVIWPLARFMSEKIEGRDSDYASMARYSVWGALYTAPTVTTWIAIARAYWPKNDLRSVVIKILVEQVTYTPFAMVSFYFGMTLLELKGVQAAKQEVIDKFIPTYKVGICIWPVFQIINYALIGEKNRIVFISCCSLIWTTFLAFMKDLTGKEMKTIYDDLHHTEHQEPVVERKN